MCLQELGGVSLLAGRLLHCGYYLLKVYACITNSLDDGLTKGSVVTGLHPYNTYKVGLSSYQCNYIQNAVVLDVSCLIGNGAHRSISEESLLQSFKVLVVQLRDMF